MAKSYIFIAFCLSISLEGKYCFASYNPEIHEEQRVGSWRTSQDEERDDSEEEQQREMISETASTLPSNDLKYFNRQLHQTLITLGDYSNKKKVHQVRDLIKWTNFHEKAARVLKAAAYCSYAVSITCYGAAVLSFSCEAKTIIEIISGATGALGAGLQYLGFKASEAHKGREKKIKKLLEKYKEIHGIYNQELRNRDLFSTGDESTKFGLSSIVGTEESDEDVEFDLTPRDIEDLELCLSSKHRDKEYHQSDKLNKTSSSSESYEISEEIESVVIEMGENSENGNHQSSELNRAPSSSRSYETSEDIKPMITEEERSTPSHKSEESWSELEEIDLHSSKEDV